MNQTEPQQARIIIGARSSRDAEAVLPLVQVFLNWRGGALVGLFCGETGSRYLVGSSQKLVTIGGHQVSPPTREAARSFSKRDSQAFQRLLTALAKQRSLSCEFVETEDDMVLGVCKTAASDDVAILAQRSIIARPGPVLMIGRDAARDDAPSRSFAEALAHHLGTPCKGLPGWSEETAEKILARIDRSHAGAIVVDNAAGVLLRRDLDRLLTAARCPVILFGATRLKS